MPKLSAVIEAAFAPEVLTSDTPVLVDFGAPWCGPCRMIAPIIKEAAGGYQGRVNFVTINTDENPDVANRHGVRSLPTLIVFKKGEPVGRIVGFRPKRDPRRRQDEALA